MKGAQWMDIRSDRQKGLSYVELGKKYHIDQRTAKRYAESPQKPEYTLSGPKPSKLDGYKLSAPTRKCRFSPESNVIIRRSACGGYATLITRYLPA